MISRELKNLLEKYQITSNETFNCSRWSIKDKKRLINALCDFYNTNTTDFVRNVIKIHNLNITVKDILKK